ncbi:NmrA family protein [Hymenobacter roseosalivarius DSM 11622]|uniref:NmrA family protein n=1 Tax=Hymenobacter roseosalivarius DSM 11622 TaxID=645990 RepID=A0A1W1VUP3_9BACT|nr:SDR family oxidoreductase [Hymenobacter roseosalivarius]SMB96821.1 NmrA family protein [Hymenobacter roseosalivarius DSM 11622]
MSHTILVTGATGTVGSELVLALANRGVTVRAGVHSIIKGDRFSHITSGVQLVEMDFHKPETLHVALTGVERVFMITPFTDDQVAISKQFIDIARQTGVRQLVRLSAAGAEAEPGIQLGRWHRDIEKHLEQSGLAYSILRPSSFMQNFVEQYSESIRHESKFYLPLGEAKVAYIDVRDIAAVAATILTADINQYNGQAYTLTGPAALSGQEVAQAIGQARGQAVGYVDVPEVAARQAMAQLPAWMTDALLELHAISKAGYAADTTPTVQELTGHAPHTIEQFAHDYQRHFQPAS